MYERMQARREDGAAPGGDEQSCFGAINVSLKPGWWHIRDAMTAWGLKDTSSRPA